MQTNQHMGLDCYQWTDYHESGEGCLHSSQLIHRRLHVCVLAQVVPDSDGACPVPRTDSLPRVRYSIR